jgi:methionine-rich copper-binding protein CopC
MVGGRVRLISATRILVAAAIAAALVLVFPTEALAHAGLLSSTPEPGTELASAPGAVTLRFSEPVNVRLSAASVTTPSGTVVDGTVAGAEEIAVQLVADTPGVYRVSWTTVSLLDGHTLSGSFAFGVGVRVGAETGVSPRHPGRPIY